MSRRLLGSWVRLIMIVALLACRPQHWQVQLVDAASLESTRHSIKINPGQLVATPTPTVPSHTFSMPDPAPTTAEPSSSQSPSLRASKQPSNAQSYISPRLPVNFTLPPPLLSEWQSESGRTSVGALDARFDAMYEEALWRRWDGDCMHVRQDRYQYTLCPFNNITQRGLQLTSLDVALG